jgi:hypothetical protein
MPTEWESVLGLSMKANLEVDGEEITIYFQDHLNENGEPTPCHICGKPGIATTIKVTEVFSSTSSMSRRSKKRRKAEKEIEAVMLVGKGCCNSRKCDRLLDDLREQEADRRNIIMVVSDC